ncbi:histidinol-phosphatase [Polycladidibacter hongkongensis]|uniref:histidinol-phosphatase n=1 Tax=Polycladidibacter hongkongensis TaxID=1647556 RepID=UPI000833985A|nr:histidinol-phosphatase [Pseudovibrio hongkongensis]
MSHSLPSQAFLHQLADAADRITLQHFRSPISVDNKYEQGFDPVTIADRDAETAIRELITSAYPEHGIIGEEHGCTNTEAATQWILDPVDGTRAFISGIPLWGTLIGLRHEGAPTLGMMSQPYNNERYWGDCVNSWYRGPLGERRLRSRQCSGLENAVLMTTTPELFKGDERTAFDEIEQQVKLSRYGTDCYGYAMVAAGQCDAVIESGLQIYDIYPLIPIIKGAGAIITNWAGGDVDDGGRVVVTGDARVHSQLLKRLSQVV